jgi:hypothetical protein
MRLSSNETLCGVQDNGGTKQYRANHRQKLGIETVSAINIPGDTTAEKQHSAGQCPQQGQTYAKLFAVRMLRWKVFIKMQMFVSHIQFSFSIIIRSSS